MLCGHRGVRTPPQKAVAGPFPGPGPLLCGPFTLEVRGQKTERAFRARPSFHREGQDPTPDTVLTRTLHRPPDSFGGQDGEETHALRVASVSKVPVQAEGLSVCP